MTALRRLMAAIAFLTVIPVPYNPQPPVNQEDWRASVRYYPVVGLFLGGLLWGLAALMHSMPVLAKAAVMVVLYTWITGGLHVDGLMDTFDALGSRKRGEEARQVMKDSRVGAFGAMAGALLLIAQVGAFASFSRLPAGLFALGPAIGRLGALWAMALEPSLRPGEGLGGQMVGLVPLWVAGCWTLVLAVVAAVIGPWPLGLATVVLGTLTAIVTGRYLTSRVGGMNGDTYGMIVEATEVVSWYALML